MKLSPSQERAVEALRHDWPDTDAFVLWAPYGLGRSTMLQAVQKERGGLVLDMASYLERLTEAEPLALEETLHQMLIGALRENDVVLVDDLHLLNSVVCCNSFYPKKDFLNAPLEVAAAFARDKGRKLVFTMPSGMPQPIAGRAHFQGYKGSSPPTFGSSSTSIWKPTARTSTSRRSTASHPSSICTRSGSPAGSCGARGSLRPTA